ncbi:hypothetical protein [Pseudomonas vancouverensis]|uniref:Uncharacterized protein n=1 Tax=Pseudomonas vancouverensis TaxID=95300 RepID=A0A1H2P1U5_PSEVA|nr:hypothetical protein [Pseudomonas vancouverensis]KAB0499603.1 hypothetical protein F7R09_00100 [Pseudomonas vancouverensis]TDB56592.1 hypothetical protein EIY72_27745 [Pseudomonas vancouverensis]SDV11648.1 hypothetical protein SAMN05216558_3465 [Pseudomonas vancouverensis]
MISDFTRNFERSATITELKLSMTIGDEYWAGTDDNLYLSLGHENKLQLLADTPRVGENITIDVDIQRLFGRSSIHISELSHVSLHQFPTDHPLSNDDWELDSLVFIANGIFTNSSFTKVQRWLGNHSTHLRQVWAGQIKWSQWSNSDLRPIDLNTQTYPVRWLPYIADLKAWRTYDPSKIDGVGQLVGMIDGKLIGEVLKTRQTEVISPNSNSDSYTWVYTPEGSIIYRRWKHTDTGDYIRHSQLGSGRPVICAGEFRVETSTHPIKQVIAHINDASGHYQPDGGACLRYVAEKLQALGIDTSETQWYWKPGPS